MELRHLRYFEAVARLRSFSKAAHELGITEPPLSRQIKELENELGSVLFDRKTKGLELTKAGEYMEVEARRIIESADMLARTVKAFSRPKDDILRIGCVNFLMYSILPPFLELVSRKAPELRIDLSIMSTEAQEKSLKAGSIDLGFVRSWMREEGFAFEPLSEERLAVIYPSGVQADEEPLRCLELLRDSSFIAFSASSAPGLADRVGAVCEKYGCRPRVGYVCSDAYSVIKLVSVGLGWSIVPDLAYRDAQMAGVGISMLPETLLLGIGYAKTSLSEGERRFVDLAKAFFAERARESDLRRERPELAAPPST